VKHFLLSRWFDVVAEYHHWRWYRLQHKAAVHHEMARYCETRSLEHEEASHV